MVIYYMDSSCLVKRYVNEIGSEWVLSITDPVAGNEIYTVRITGVEVVSAVSRRKRDGTIISADVAMVIATFYLTIRSIHICSYGVLRGWS